MQIEESVVVGSSTIGYVRDAIEVDLVRSAVNSSFNVSVALSRDGVGTKWGPNSVLGIRDASITH